jgi:hypothetical protein
MHLIKHIAASIVLFCLNNATAQVQISNGTSGLLDITTNWTATFQAPSYMNAVFDESQAFRGMPKIDQINAGTNDDTYTASSWPDGAWGHGYYQDLSGDFYSKNIGNSSTMGFYATHPLIRDCARMLRAHVQIHDFLDPTRQAQNLDIIKTGVDYLMDQQINDGSANDGAYYWWFYRKNQFEGNPGDSPINDPGQLDNSVNDYAVSRAIRALSETYFFLEEKNIHYRQDDIYDAIVAASNWFIQIDLRIKSDGKGTRRENYASEGLHGLSLAYKITKNCYYLDYIYKTVSYLAHFQEKDPSSLFYGVWKGAIGTNASPMSTNVDKVNFPNGHPLAGQVHYEFYHETHINYHLIILRGLISAMDVVSTSSAIRTDLIQAVKRATNHVIDTRLKLEPAKKWFKQIDRSINGTLIGGTWSNPSTGQSGSFDSYVTSGERAVEPFALLHYYAKRYNQEFTQSEIDRLYELFNHTGLHVDLTHRPPSIPKNPTVEEYRLDHFVSAAYYLKYREAEDLGKDVFPWEGVNQYYTASRITDRVVSGDFDHDGTIDEIAAFYYWPSGPNQGTYLNVWDAHDDKFSFDFQSHWKDLTFDATKLTGKVISGDFDGDSYEDDIAGFVDDGTNVNLLVWYYNHSNGTFNNPVVEWTQLSSLFDVTKIESMVVSGDFNNDGLNNDIAALASYPSATTRLWVWEGLSGAGFNSSAKEYWVSNPGECDGDKMRGRVVSVDIDGDGRKDDVVAFYDLNVNHTRLWMWSCDGSSLPQVPGGAEMIWEGTSCNANSLTGRVVAGDFDKDTEYDDIAAFMDIGNNSSILWAWRSDGSQIGPHGAEIYWESDPGKFNVNLITGRVVSGNFDSHQEDPYHDNIAAMSAHDVQRAYWWQWSYNTSTEKMNSAEIWWEVYNNGHCDIDNETFPNVLRLKPESKNEEELTSTALEIYPNPNRGNFIIESSKEVGGIQEVLVRSITGTVVMHLPVSNRTRLEVSATGLSNGIYLVEVRTSQRIFSHKIVIQK